MRLIDAEPFDAKKCAVPEGNKDYRQGYMDGVNHVLYEMGKQPVIDAAPVRRGYWKFTGYAPEERAKYQCSVCNYAVYAGKSNRFCSNCGAMMGRA